MKKKIDFIKEFIKNPIQIGSIMPSSKFLAKAMVKSAQPDKAKCIVELGSGTGIVTKQILKELPDSGVLFAFEINSDLCEQLRNSIKDSRLILINDSAENIDKYLNKYGYKNVDCIISCLPLAFLSKNTADRILNLAEEYLVDDGIYVQFQYSLKDLKRLKYFFSYIAINFEILNIPPAFIYVCTKSIKVLEKGKVKFNVLGDILKVLRL